MDVWIDITFGVFPDTEPIEGPLKLGDNLTLAIYVKDSANNTDIRVKDCYAYDNIKSAKNGVKPAQLQLTGENGCPLRDLMSVWRRTVNTMDTGATMIAFNNFKAFKFPEKDSVFLACNIDLCRENCTERCEAETANPDEEPPMNEDEMNGNQQEQQNLGSDYEDLNNVGPSSQRGSIASNKRQKQQQQQPENQRNSRNNNNQQPPLRNVGRPSVADNNQQRNKPQPNRPQQNRPQPNKPQLDRPQQQRNQPGPQR